MIVREALRSIRNDMFRSFFFWLTFLLTSMFIFLFFNLSYEIGDEGVMTIVTVFMVIVCTMDIFFVNHFYMTSKAKDLAVRLICGATYTYLSFYLLIQVVLLLLLALPIGIGLGYALIPVFNSVLQIHVVVTGDAMLRVSIMIGYIIYWILLFNLSFTYKSAASMMFNMQSEMVSGKSNVLTLRGGKKTADLQRKILFPQYMCPLLRGGKKTADLQRKILFPLYLCPLLLLLDPQKPAVICAGLCLVLFFLVFSGVWIPYLNDRLTENITDPIRNVHLGFHRMNVRYMKTNILLLNGSALFVFALLDQAIGNRVLQITILMSYGMICFLLWFAYLFQYETRQLEHGKDLTTLFSLGYTKESLTHILKKEVVSLYGSTLLFYMIDFIPIMISHISKGAAGILEMILMTLCYVVPCAVCASVSLYTAKRLVRTMKTVK
ncbi:MAG: hypothetical protein ACI32N_00375 [Bulleidia sp.]